MDFEYPHLKGVGKCEFHAWEWDNSKFDSASFSIPYDSTSLMQGTQYPLSNLVMPQLHRKINRLSLHGIAYAHTGKKKSVSIDEVLSSEELMRHNVRPRALMVESIYTYFDTNLPEVHRAKMYICKLIESRFKSYKMWPTRK
jgi:hypothetical protein